MIGAISERAVVQVSLSVTSSRHSQHSTQSSEGMVLKEGRVPRMLALETDWAELSNHSSCHGCSSPIANSSRDNEGDMRHSRRPPGQVACP